MKQKLRINELEQLISGIVEDHKRLDAACDAAIRAGAMDINGPLHEAIWMSFQHMLDRLDAEGWISWFIYENKYGEKALTVGCNSSLHEIKTVEQLASFIASLDEANPSTGRSNADVDSSPPLTPQDDAQR